MRISKEEIGSFTVKTGEGETREIMISQKTATYYGKENSFAGNFLNLDSIDEPSVKRTERENIIRVEDGAELRRRWPSF